MGQNACWDNLLGGTNISFPGPPQVLSAGITINGSNDVITFANAGTYFISYQVNTTAGVLLNTRLMINGAQAAGSVVSPVSVQFFGAVGGVTLNWGRFNRSSTKYHPFKLILILW
ncbi:BclA C-terminal domain-containing protein [Paenibacillus sp. FSL R5-0345]|uniref:BclA C-terminal domain-containing protein n=1 Tax=Paenibacillus sp. FSL R5-0345 TaxID=1536770 RepID=UPI000694C806|nr:hypothetical protein [Paenibacillus sp. FSL R5-0345]